MEIQAVKHQLQIGYRYAMIGAVIGVLLALRTQSILVCLMSSCFFSYLVWSGYWGGIIIEPHIDAYFDVPVSAPTLWDAISERRKKFIAKTVSRFTLSLVVGFLGGAIYKQIRLGLWLRNAERTARMHQNQRFRINS